MLTYTLLVLFLRTMATTAQSCPPPSPRHLPHMPPSLLPQSHPDPFQFHLNSACLSSPGSWDPGSAPRTTLRVQQSELPNTQVRPHTLLLKVHQLPSPGLLGSCPGHRPHCHRVPSFALLSSLAFPQLTPAILPCLSFREGPKSLKFLSSSCLDSHPSSLGVPGSISLSSRIGLGSPLQEANMPALP